MRTFNAGDTFLDESGSYYVYVKYSINKGASLFMVFSICHHALIDEYSFKQLADRHIQVEDCYTLVPANFNMSEAFK